MRVEACQTSPNFGVKFSKANIKYIVKADAERFQKNLLELQNPEIKLDSNFKSTEENIKKYNLQVADAFKKEAENRKIGAALEQFKKTLQSMAKYGDSETNIAIRNYEELKKHINPVFNLIERGFAFEISNPKFDNWVYPIKFKHDFKTQGEIPAEKNPNLYITPLVDFFENKTYSQYNRFSLGSENFEKDFIQALELIYLNQIVFRSRAENDIVGYLQSHNIADPHWHDIAYKLICIRKGDSELVSEENELFNRALDNYVEDLGIF